MIVLGIDQGNASGWGIVRGTPGLIGRVLYSGTACDAFARSSAVTTLHAAGMCGEPLLAVAEDHSAMPLTFKTRHDGPSGRKAQRSTKSILGQGASLGRWQHPLEIAGIELRKVTPNEWFCAMSGMPASTRTADRKAWAIQYAQAALGGKPIDHNHAEGVCIALWGALNLAPKAKG
jgi:hypothetical protein